MQSTQPLPVEQTSGGNAHVQKKLPKVTIGMPVYNGERLIRNALDSILAQSYDDFVLIISDNSSNDGTGEICLEYARRDPRIRYIRQPVNKGASFNFRFVFDQAATEYFMWAACDDVRSPDFLEVNLRFLEANPDYVGSTSPVKFAGGGFDEVRMGDRSLTGKPFDNMATFFQTWHANGRFYSLFRRDAIAGWEMLGEHFLGSDWALILHLIGIGKLNRSTRGWVTLGAEGVSNSRDIFAIFRRTLFDWLLPFNRLSLYVWTLLEGATARQKLAIARRLLRLNAQAFVAQFRVMKRRQRAQG